jgi:hypothetical protein
MSAGQTLISANFTYNDSSIIGEGRYGVVFDGTYFGINVAVKRIQRFQVNPHTARTLRKQQGFQVQYSKTFSTKECNYNV